MIVYVIAAAQALGYLAAVPLYLALRLRVDDGVRLGVGVGAFERRFALKKAAARPKKRRRRHGAGLGLRCLRRAGVEQILREHDC